MTENADARSDEEIALAVQSGDAESFGILMRRYSARLMRYAHRFLADMDDAEDAVEEAYIRAYRNIRSFDPVKKFSPWIYRIVHNQAINFLEKKGIKVEVAEWDVLFPFSGVDDRDDEVVTHEFMRNVEKLIGGLDVKYREPLILYYLQELDYKEISTIMNIPVGTVGIRIKRGRELLKKAWQEQETR